jgi:hypothetical protein
LKVVVARFREKNAMSKYTSFLFVNPSFCEGMGRILDFGNTMTEYNYSKSPAEADHRAMKEDWLAVGADIRMAIAEFDKEFACPLTNSPTTASLLKSS